MSPMAALIKFNIPEQLQARNIRIKASAPIAGTVTVNPQKGWGGIGDNALLQSEGLHDEIVIESEDPVGGDLYVVVMPDSFDKESNAYCNTAQTITFSCDYYEGELAKRYSLNDYIVCGAVTDLGQIPMPKPKIPVEPGTIRLLSDINLTVAIDGSDPDCEYYYEVGTSAETCPVPTINSTKFDPQSGFCPEIKGHFDRFYIKVRAHALSTDYSDVVIEASLRNWTFTDGSEAGAILAEAFAGNKLTVKNEQITTSEGMILKRKQDYAANDLKFEQTSARIALVSAKIALYMPVEYDSQATMWFCIDKRTCIGTGKRGFNLYYNDNSGRVNEFNGYNVKTLVDGAVEATSGKKAILWPLGQLHEGDKVAPAGDGQHVLYSMALLEVL